MAEPINRTGKPSLDRATTAVPLVPAIDSKTALRQYTEAIAPDDLTFFEPAKGISTVTRLNRTPREYGPVLLNVMLERGHLFSRFGLEAVGPISNDPIMLALDLSTITGTIVTIRFTTRNMQVFDGSNWNNVSGVVLTGGVEDYFTTTSFGNKLIFSNGIDGLFSFDPGTGIATQLAPGKIFGVKQLTTFDNRVVASNVSDDTGVHPTRIRWSEKNDETKWNEVTDIGAGFEDLVTSPGTDADIVWATFPVTDELALTIRYRSVWLLSLTGFVDAPFHWSLLYDQFGTEYPNSLVRVTGGVAGLFHDDFYVVSNQQPAAIGTLVIDDLLKTVKIPISVYGTYDRFRREYRVSIPDDAAVWRYSFKESGWSKDEFPFAVRSMAPAFRRWIGTTIDALPGFIDGLSGVIDGLSGPIESRLGMYLSPLTANFVGPSVFIDGLTGFIDQLTGTIDQLSTPSNNGGLVCGEFPGDTTDIDTRGANVDSPIEIRTAGIVPAKTIEKVEIDEVQLEYEADESQLLIFEYSSDGGVTWTSYSSFTIQPTTRPETLSVRQTVSADMLQFRVRSTTLGSVRLLALHAFTTRGGMVKP